jgi:hypothetical protein
MMNGIFGFCSWAAAGTHAAACPREAIRHCVMPRYDAMRSKGLSCPHRRRKMAANRGDPAKSCT